VHERKWIRFPSAVPSVVVAHEQSGNHVGEVLDESLMGLAIRVERLDGLAPNQPVRVEYRGAPASATVRYIRPTTDGGYRVGIEWQEAGVHSASAAAEALGR
jgi:hypothetical protein